jgi:hypothetical protein
LVKQLEAFHGSIDRAAANSGICVRTLFRKMRLYGLDKKQFRPRAPEISFPPEVSSIIENKVGATNPHSRH